jgi:hypothetical protein
MSIEDQAKRSGIGPQWASHGLGTLPEDLTPVTRADAERILREYNEKFEELEAARDRVEAILDVLVLDSLHLHPPSSRIHNPDAFQAGDRVKVVGEAFDQEGGWAAYWTIPMDATIGAFGVVDACKWYGVEVTLEEGKGVWLYPSFVLRKVDE